MHKIKVVLVSALIAVGVQQSYNTLSIQSSIKVEVNQTYK